MTDTASVNLAGGSETVRKRGLEATALHTPGPWVAKDSPGAGLGIWADLRPALGDKYSADFQIYGQGSLPPPRVQIAYEAWVQFPSERWKEMQEANARRIVQCVNGWDDLVAALQLVRMSRGWQYLSDESRTVIDAALSRATPADQGEA